MSSRLRGGGGGTWRGFPGGLDAVLVLLTALLVSVAVVNLNSAGAGDWTGLVRGQIGFVLVGAVAMFTVAFLDYRVLYRLGYTIYGVGLALVVLVAVVGVTTNSAERWLRLGMLTFQPSEPMKLFLILGIARYLQELSESSLAGTIRGLIIPGVMTVVPAALILQQPDLSTSVVLGLIALSMLALAQLTLRSTLILSLLGVSGMMLGWRLLMEDYQRERIDVWLNPETHAEGAGYQILQARIAVGNGGIFGRGVGEGSQNLLNFVPYKESDFAFAVFAEEWGFLGGCMLLLVVFVLVAWLLNLASQARDRFSALVCVGVAALFFWHTVLNVGVVLEFIPNTGLPLPFFTHGGSNVVTMMLSLGVVSSISRARRER